MLRLEIGDRMKHLIAICVLLPLAAWGIDREQLDAMLQTAATNQGPDYLAARNAIANDGTNALPTLAQAGCDAHLSWQQRLVARIAYERIVRGKEIDALRSYDWRTHPGYDAKWVQNQSGPERRMSAFVIPDLRGAGLWYYYLEIKWKQTGETPRRPQERIAEYWPNWCFGAVKDGPERVWFLRVCSDLMADPNTPGQVLLGVYDTLSREKKSDTVPLLAEYYDKCRQLRPGVDSSPAERDAAYRMAFASLSALADSRHVEALNKFMSGKLVLASLTNTIAAVRDRKVAEQSDPPFRLGTNTVVVLPCPPP